jgi:predicted lipoprotein with Yx(FWY)xxD motif
VLVDPDWTVGPGLDTGIFSTIPRDDGTEQLVAGQWPLYYYSGDSAPGDVNGQGAGEVWYVVGTDATLIKDAAPAAEASAATSVQLADSPLGQILVDAEGNTLYGFTNDVDGIPSCVDDCAEAWPPLLVDSAELPAGLDPALYSVAERPDGTFQLVAGMWPLYWFSGDAAAGETNGQGTGGVWFAVAPDGSLIRDEPAAEGASTESTPETTVDDGY